MINRPPKILLVIVGAIGCCALRVVSAVEDTIDFVRDVKPIFANRCILCHHSEALFGNLNLENRAHAFKDRPGGPAILPGRPDSSPLHFVLRLPPKDTKAMPPTGHRIPDREMKVIYDWIKQGASWPGGADGIIKPVLVPKE